jgi:hypothetical protein
MNRIYNITTKNLYLSNTHQNIDIDNLGSIVDHSADQITVYCLNYVDSKDTKTILGQIFNKTKPTATVTVRILDFKKYASDFIDNKVLGSELLKQIDQFKNILDLDDIYSMVDSHFKIIQIHKENNYIYITTQRIAL